MSQTLTLRDIKDTCEKLRGRNDFDYETFGEVCEEIKKVEQYPLEWDKLTLDELRNYCIVMGIDSIGNKRKLCKRVEAFRQKLTAERLADLKLVHDMTCPLPRLHYPSATKWQDPKDPSRGCGHGMRAVKFNKIKDDGSLEYSKGCCRASVCDVYSDLINAKKFVNNALDQVRWSKELVLNANVSEKLKEKTLESMDKTNQLYDEYSKKVFVNKDEMAFIYKMIERFADVLSASFLGRLFTNAAEFVKTAASGVAYLTKRALDAAFRALEWLFGPLSNLWHKVKSFGSLDGQYELRGDKLWDVTKQSFVHVKEGVLLMGKGFIWFAGKAYHTMRWLLDNKYTIMWFTSIFHSIKRRLCDKYSEMFYSKVIESNSFTEVASINTGEGLRQMWNTMEPLAKSWVLSTLGQWFGSSSFWTTVYSIITWTGQVWLIPIMQVLQPIFDEMFQNVITSVVLYVSGNDLFQLFTEPCVRNITRAVYKADENANIVQQSLGDLANWWWSIPSEAKQPAPPNT